MDIEFTPERIFFDETDQQEWQSYLQQFNEKMLPVFRHFGFEKNVALLAVLINTEINALWDLDAPPEEPWEEV